MAIKKKTKKLLLWGLLIAVVIGIPVTYLGAKYVLKRRFLAWRAEGMAAAQAGDHERAAHLLGRYLQRVSLDAQAVEALEVYVKSREQAELPNGQHLVDTMGALKILIGQIDAKNDVGRNKLQAHRRALLELYLRFGRLPEAIDLCNAILKEKDAAAKDPRVHELKVEALIQTQQDQAALEAANEWAKYAPNDLKLHMARATARTRLRHPASQIINETVASKTFPPGDPRFEFLQAFVNALAAERASSHDELKKHLGTTATLLRQAAARKNLDESLVLLLVNQFDRLAMTEDAVALLEKSVNSGGSAQLRHALAKRMWERGMWEKAALLLADVDPARSDSDATLAAFRAASLAASGKKADADKLRGQLANRNRAAARAWTLLLRRLLDGAGVDEKDLAAQCASAMLLDPQNPYLAYHYGEAKARIGDLDLAIESWHRAAFINPGWNLPVVRLVDAYLNKGEIDRAKVICGNIFERSDMLGNKGISAALAVTAAKVRAAEAVAAGKADDELLQALAKLREQLPGDEHVLSFLIQLRAQRHETFKADADKARASGNVKDAEELASKSTADKSEALRLVRSALAQTPPPTEWLLMRAASVSRRSALGLEQECFALSEKAHGLTPVLAQGRAADHLLTGKGDAGLIEFDKVAVAAGVGETGSQGFVWKRDDVAW
jgi:tetratricopeptide (TPR) repeat protein